MNADERRFEVLRAIVADYVSHQEPVGSKVLVERYNLGVSSATVRNDMAALEEEGYIVQPHTSAGRVAQRIVDLGDVITDDAVSRLRSVLNTAMVGERLPEASVKVAELPEQAPPELRAAM